METENRIRQQKIFVLGNNLFTVGLAKALGTKAGFSLVGHSPLSPILEPVGEIIVRTHANLVIADSTDENVRAYITNLIFDYPYLSFIFANLANYSVQVVSSYLIQPDTSAITNAVELVAHIKSQPVVKE